MIKKAAFLFLIQIVFASAQTFNITKIDTAAFPLIKANTLILTEMGNKYPQINTTDFRVIENGIDLSSTLELSCPSSQPDKTANIIVAVEQSLSMKREVANNITVFDWVSDELKYFFNNFQFQDSTKIGLISFNTLANKVVGLTNDRSELIQGLGKIQLEGSTLYDDIFIGQVNSAVALLKNTPPDRHRIIIMITTKKPIGTIGEIVIMNSLKQNNCRLFVISVDMPENNLEINSIAQLSGGKYYEPKVKESIRINLEAIKQEINKDLPICLLSWKSNYACSAVELAKSVKIKFLPQYAEITNDYKMDSSYLASPEFLPASLNFGARKLNETANMKVSLTAKNAPLEISNIYITPSAYFSISDMGGSNPPFTIGKDESRTFTVQFTQKNELDYRKAFLVIDGKPCPPFLPIEGGQEGITLDKPNGGELYSICESIPIKWSGVDKYRAVNLYFSTNGGASWQNVKQDTNGGSMSWKPFLKSNNYKIAASPIAMKSYFWLNGFGGTEDDIGASIVMTKNSIGFYIAGTFSDKIKIGNYNLTSAGKTDMFIARFDSDGNCLWALGAGGPNEETATGVTVDDVDNVYVTGSLMNGAKVGSMVLNTYSQTNPYSCVIRLNPKGLNPTVDLIGSVFPNPEAKAWGSRIGYSAGKIYVRGLYTGNIDKESFRISGDSLQGIPYKKPQVFSAEFDTSFAIKNLIKNGQNYGFYSKTTVTSADNFQYEIGSFTGTFTSDELSVKSKGKNDFYLRKYGTKPTDTDESDTTFIVQGPLLSVVRDTVDFGNSLIRDSIEISYDTLFCNTGTHSMLIDSIVITGKDSLAFSFPPESKQISLDPGECHTYPLQFKPTKLGKHNALLNIWAECYNKKSIRLLGIGDCGFKGKEFVDLEKVYLDSVKTITSDTVFWNINSIPMEITARVEGVNADEFSIEPKGKMTILPGQALGFNIQFKPKDKGIRNATINYNIKDTTCVKFETNLIGEGVEFINGITDYENQNINSVKVIPNPAGNSFEIHFILKSPDYLSIAMYNTLGEKVATLLRDGLVDGMYKLAADTPDIPNGVYYLKITGSSTEWADKIVINK